MRQAKDARKNQEVRLVIKEVKIEFWSVAPVVVETQRNYLKSKSVTAWNAAQVDLTPSRLKVRSDYFIIVN